MAIDPQVARQIDRYVIQQQISQTSAQLEQTFARLQALIARSVQVVERMGV